MDLKFSIDADYAKASKAFKDLANESETTREKIEKFSKSFQDKNIDDFINKQKLLEASLTGTRGEVAAMTTAQKNYQHEIERLIRSGLDPESEAIQRLRTEQDSLGKKVKETTETQKAQQEAMKNAEKAALGMLAAIGAAVAAMGVVIQKTAEAGDQYAKTARIIGMTAETFQELNYAAKMSGIDNLKGSLEKLNKSVADVKNGTGTLTTYLKQNDQQLLSQLENVNSNEEAFNLLMDAIGKAPDEFTKAELAQSAFGKSGQQLILMANEGADGIANLREEARKYGIISNDAAKKSEDYLDAQDRLKAAIQGVGNEITDNMLPGLTDTINGIADFIANIDDWEGKLNFAKIAIAGTTAALVAFVAVSKSAAVIEKMGAAITKLHAAVMGPAGAAALIIGGLVTAFAAFSVYQEKQKNEGKEVAERIEEQSNKAHDLLSVYERLNPQKALDEETTQKLIKLYPELTDKIKASGGVVADLQKQIEEIDNKKFEDEATGFLEKAKKKYDEYLRAKAMFESPIATSEGEDSLRVYRRSMERAFADFETEKNKINDVLDKIGKEVDVENEFAFIKSTKTQLLELAAEATETEAKVNRAMSQRLSDTIKTETQIENERINQIKSFLNQRADLERTEGEARIKSFQAELERIKQNEYITDEERIAAEKAVNEATLEIRKKINEDIKKEQDRAAKEEQDQKDEEAKKEETRLKDEAEKEKTFVRDKLETLKNLEAYSLQERQEQFSSFLSQQLEIEQKDGEERLEYLEEQKNLLLAQFEGRRIEQLAIQAAYDAKVIEEEEKLKQRERKILEERLGAYSTLFNGLSSLIEVAGEKNRGAAIAARTLAASEAAINSYLAFTKALASSAPPFNYILAAGVLASGLAQQIKIIGTPIPSAESGGWFIVPHSVGSDSTYMRVNSDEQVDITPRGLVGSKSNQNIIVQIDKQTIFDVVNDGIRSNDILISTANF
jgi:hypothetical protein